MSGVNQHQLAPFPGPTPPWSDQMGPVNVRGNDNAIVAQYNAHDADASMHLAGSSTTGTIPAANVTPGTFSSYTSSSGPFGFAGNVTVAGSVLSSSAKAGIGYTVGAGGVVTQLTDKTTAFTLNTVTGKITFASGTLLGFAASSSATWTNSAMASNDVVIFNQVGGTIGAYNFNAITSAGTAQIVITNLASLSLNEAPVVKFALIKGAQS